MDCTTHTAVRRQVVRVPMDCTTHTAVRRQVVRIPMDCTTHTAASSVPDVAYSRSLTPRIITWLIRVGTSENVTKSGVLAEVKEEIYQSCVLDNSQTNDELRRLEKRVGELESANTALRDDSDAQEQYSRSNCLLVHGIPEDQTDTSDAVLSLCNAQLGLDLDRGHIDRSHRLGHRSETQTTVRRNRGLSS